MFKEHVIKEVENYIKYFGEPKTNEEVKNFWRMGFINSDTGEKPGETYGEGISDLLLK